MKKYLIVMGLVVAAISLNFVSKESIKAGSSFLWSTTVYEFGSIAQGKPVTAEFSFQNMGDAPLIIVSTKGSCGCTVADFTKGEIQPGEFGKVTATYNAKKLGAFRKTVTVYANTGDEPMVLTIQGDVVI